MDRSQERTTAIDKVTSEVKEKLGSGEAVSTRLMASERIIARVTDGIYREPWAAFRELIANAYDADATRVVVETGAPDFEQVIVRDDGNGMTPEAVVYLVKSIGGSSKRTRVGKVYNTVSAEDSELSPKGRPLIGKIGIGLFAVAQLTQHFQILTKASGSNVRISAAVRLHTYDDEQFGSDTDESYEAGEVTITTEKVRGEELDSHGTTIVLYSLRPEIRRSLQSYNRWLVSQKPEADAKSDSDSMAYHPPPAFHIGALPNTIPGFSEGIEAKLPWRRDAEPSERFRQLVDAAGNVSGRYRAPADLDHFDEYLKLVWKLSLALPLRYQGQHPFNFRGDSGVLFLDSSGKKQNEGMLRVSRNQTIRDKLRLSTFDHSRSLGFHVIIDGTELLRPIELPAKLRRKSRISAPMLLVDKVAEAFKDRELERAGGQLSV